MTTTEREKEIAKESKWESGKRARSDKERTKERKRKKREKGRKRLKMKKRDTKNDLEKNIFRKWERQKHGRKEFCFFDKEDEIGAKKLAFVMSRSRSKRQRDFDIFVDRSIKTGRLSSG